jgi:hypothetical protein
MGDAITPTTWHYSHDTWHMVRTSKILPGRRVFSPEPPIFSCQGAKMIMISTASLQSEETHDREDLRGLRIS